jgi:hypothetical protein
MTLSQSGSFKLAPLEIDPATVASDPQILKFYKRDTNEYYYFSYRQPLGYDSTLASQFVSGISVHRYAGGVIQTYLLGVLTDGGSFTDVTNGINVTQLSHDSTGANVQVVVGQLQAIGNVSPTSLTFAQQIINTTSPARVVRLDNTGNVQMTVSAFQITSDYAIQTNYCTNGVKPNTHCDIYMTFTPTAIGTRVGALTIVSNAINSPQVVNLAGTGIAAGGAVGAISPTSLTFPRQLINTTSATQHVRLSNTGTAQMTVSSFQLSGDYAIKTNYCTSGVKPATGCDMYLTFTPKGAGTRAGKLSIVSNASNSPQTMNLSGVGTMVSLSPANITFPTQVLNTTSTAKSVTLSNKGTTALTIGSISIAGNFAIPSKTCGTSLAAATSCTINVNFKPAAIGTRTGSLSIAHNGGGSPTVVSLSGTGTAVTLTPTSLAFGSVVVGVNGPAKVVTLKNYGVTTLSITGSSISGDFLVSAKSCSTSLAPSATCTYSIRFKPSIKGARTGAFSVSHNGGGSPSKVALGGTGI